MGNYYLHVSYRFDEPKQFPMVGDTLIVADKDTNMPRLRHKIASEVFRQGFNPSVQPVIVSISELSKGLYKALARENGELETPKERL